MDLDRAAAAVAELLDAFGVQADDHTRDTPGRVARAWAERLSGYGEDPARHLATTFTGPPSGDLVVVSGIRVTTTCAHHLLPITGTATVAYRPGEQGRLVGLSKLARVVEDSARRLQVQETLTYQVAAAVSGALDPVGAGCVITAHHGCMAVRGIRQPAALTMTASWQGRWTPQSTDARTVLDEHRASARAGGLIGGGG
ncbi:GTP cyclohydrolase [Frankia sp. R43]|uniref:GTP cyclohydrolase I n=1 Tax=Frankia sp. R43 TaxID=269536 RepID=UPI0006C9F8F6|nr:GTP cyclohydrolase I [Frankia sp. R43]KPM55754.1 GTP cyclohydrolase [Frankia sp. R43]